jgi:hypothetical protein
MPSQAHQELEARLRDVEELINAHTTVTGGEPGRPAARQGAAITRAGIVLLAAATEAFVEDLFEEAARLIFADMPNNDLERLFRNTSKRLNNASVHNIEMLYFNLGMPWVLQIIAWRKFPNGTLRKELDKLIEGRNTIAHGRGEMVRLQTLRRWKNMIEMLAPRFVAKLADRVEEATGQRPEW